MKTKIIWAMGFGMLGIGASILGQCGPNFALFAMVLGVVVGWVEAPTK